MKSYSCIIFDMDGTLTQTNQLIFDSFNHIAAKYLNRRMAEREIIELFGPPEKECIQSLVGGSRIEEVMKDYYEFYHDRHDQLARMYPGVSEFLQYLQSRNVTLALFTGKGRRTTDITLEKFGINRYFEMTVTGDDVEEHKPSGNGILKIMNRFSLTAGEVLMVGDAVADIKAARETGVRIASVLWDSYAKTDVLKYDSDFVFHTVDELFSWLKTLYQ